MEAGKLLENLPVLWEEADLAERRKLLMAMLDAVYVDTVEEKSVVAIRSKPAFRPTFAVATTREGSGIALINQTPQTQGEPEASESCPGGDGGELNSKHGPTVAHALRELSLCLTRLANALDK